MAGACASAPRPPPTSPVDKLPRTTDKHCLCGACEELCYYQAAWDKETAHIHSTRLTSTFYESQHRTEQLFSEAHRGKPPPQSLSSIPSSFTPHGNEPTQRRTERTKPTAPAARRFSRSSASIYEQRCVEPAIPRGLAGVTPSKGPGGTLLDGFICVASVGPLSSRGRPWAGQTRQGCTSAATASDELGMLFGCATCTLARTHTTGPASAARCTTLARAWPDAAAHYLRSVRSAAPPPPGARSLARSGGPTEDGTRLQSSGP